MKTSRAKASGTTSKPLISTAGLLARHWKPILACIQVLNNDNRANVLGAYPYWEAHHDTSVSVCDSTKDV
jgi:hypothetical protein